MDRLALLLSIWFCLCPLLALGQTYDYGLPFEELAPRRSADSQVIIGRLPSHEDGSVPLRLEIRQLHKKTEQWNLFILAMNFLQALDQDDPLSWYQIAGIHGVPFQPWNGVKAVPGASESGYCTHSSVLFPMWHRPYLALIEQQLYFLVHKIADLYPESERASYRNAARDFRLPYWDWAAPSSSGKTHLPEYFWDAQINQSGPNGTQIIKNPLYSYEFHPLDSGVFPWTPLKWWNETKRAPNITKDVKNPASNNQQVNDALSERLSEIQQRLFVLFSSYKDFNAFSNKVSAQAQNASSWDSIESVHDIIHIYGGLNGHLTYVPLSSFDPLFFLHHAMTDRLIAMWQALNPKAWISPTEAGETSYTTLKGTLQSSSTALTPFLIGDGQYWTSDLARVPEAFGYSYAEVDVSSLPPQEVRLALIQHIIEWYGQTSPVGLRALARTKQALATTAKMTGPLLRRPFGKWQSQDAVDWAELPIEETFKDGHYTEWVANVQVNLEALDGNFGIHFYLGEPVAEGITWNARSGRAAHEVGAVGIFAMNRTTGSEAKISGTLPMTSALMERVATGELADLSPDTVVPYLRHMLRFKVWGSNHAQVDPTSVDGLYIMITSSDVSAPEELVELPAWGPSIQRLELWKV
ncbi:hypothetical protein S40285_05491 [Stachybotrys chlorohalonatus IBT 40285]|uniref:tyrosinase n=1 Tax=Stachybotrys chlorohalonatus (strain IBT 40285) TaxID=1283841 RepID=A0A084QJ67_STAC4|nr:hypothetical protein S40285_05491 [Stachybotrys chlorohalonata IBT 40285]